ncbi:uncharacterized protein [Drosophila kikkawai]|uniref:Uncharacterized protein n=1 Tax=Drosophila kikkawai TaxID=30033 RepID=A0A6P4INN3_DROKI|nr:uncharacterized protein LOC108076669 [Drosophila kikkawai]
MLKLDTKGGIICTGILSIAFAITYLAFMDDYFWRSRHYPYVSKKGSLYDLGIHISALQIFGSLSLLIGAFKQNYKFFVPWMITTGFFFYLMLYLTIHLLTTNLRSWIFIPAMVFPFTVYLSCAFYSVQKEFNRMRKDEPPVYSILPDKKNYISHF